LCWQDKVYSHFTLKKLKQSSKHACLVLFSSFGAIGVDLNSGVHPHQVLATSSSKRGLCRNKKSERVRGNASTQPCGLCHDKKSELVRGNTSTQPLGLCHNRKSEQAGGKASTFQLIVELFLNLNWVGARVVLITSYLNSVGEWSCCDNVNYA
jgi:hypothetical protein